MKRQKKFNREKSLNVGKRTTQFKNVSWNRLRGFWVGAKRYNGNQRIHASGKTPLEAARKLNQRCLEHGLEAPNPHAEKITWKTIEQQMNENTARREIIDMNSAWVEKWETVLHPNKLKSFFKMMSGTVLSELETKRKKKKKGSSIKNTTKS